MLDDYFAKAGDIHTSNAWEHVYKLLLWIDRTTGLAHCYESDKAQPGRPWYARSLSFHDWISQALGVQPSELNTHIDWLFAQGTERLATVLSRQRDARDAAAATQREPYAGRGFPPPGEDPAFEKIVVEELGRWLNQPPADAIRRLTQRVRIYFGEENKRKNLVGEGFEDVLCALIQSLPNAPKGLVSTRPQLHTLPGFRSPPANEKPRKVDLAIVRDDGRRILVSAKWSVRADREEQFVADFEAYSRLEDAGRDFEFVLVTNEFDAARLAAACERRRPNGSLFSAVVHVNPEGPLAAYGPNARRSAVKLTEHVRSGRLMSLDKWLQLLAV